MAYKIRRRFNFHLHCSTQIGAPPRDRETRDRETRDRKTRDRKTQDCKTQDSELKND